MSFLTIQEVTYGYEKKGPVLQNIHWSIPQGQFHCLLGKSGCGKTTLLKLASGLLLPDEGTIALDHQQVKGPSPSSGYVFQAPTLLEWKTAMENILLPISLKRKPSPEDVDYARHLLDLMGLSGYQDQYPKQLSGGQQSRVAIARALIQRPAMLFLDEPFAALDAITREELQDDLLRLCQLNQTTVLFITHDIAEAVYLSDRVAVMAEGKLVHEVEVPLPKPRQVEMRVQPTFSELCWSIRQAMNGGQK